MDERLLTMKRKDLIPGGKADHKSESDFDKKSLLKGQKVEKEHTSSPVIAKEIAMDHLSEDPRYYDKLELIEKKAFVSSFEKVSASTLEKFMRKYVPGSAKAAVDKAKRKHLTTRLLREKDKGYGYGQTAAYKIDAFAKKKNIE
jgi:predicted HD phosphohydrolase